MITPPGVWRILHRVVVDYAAGFESRPRSSVPVAQPLRRTVARSGGQASASGLPTNPGNDHVPDDRGRLLSVRELPAGLGAAAPKMASPFRRASPAGRSVAAGIPTLPAPRHAATP